MARSLDSYNKKRHFDKTGEPHGDVGGNKSNRLAFVVQHHIASHDHYDFRLEWDGVLKSWAVPKGPSYSSRDKRLAVQVEDHPLDYRHFEGAIPKGEYGGGVVMIWDEGVWLPQGDVDDGFAAGSLKFTLEGTRLKGAWALVRMKPKPGEKRNNWLLIKEKDEYENANGIGGFTTSVTTGRTMSEIEAGENDATAQTEKAGTVKPSKRKSSLSMDDFALTHPDKILYRESGITKGDIAAYYLKVAERMLPYLEKRIVSVVRCPGGIEKSCFYKKHPANAGDGIVAVAITEKDGKEEQYYYVADRSGMMFEVQMNTLEFHVWGSRVETLENPDVMVFDLDPDEQMELSRIRQGVADLKNILDQIPLVSYLKTSGGKGYHVVIPFKPAAGWDDFHEFARNIAKTMEAKWPDRYTANVRKNQRSNRIFIDWIRNGRGATSVVPYSVRTREGAPVSMPISWKELGKVAPQGVCMDDAVARLRRKDPWEGFFDTAQRLKTS